MDDADEARATIEVVLPVSSINAFVDKAHETSRLLLEGERVLEAGHVFSCSVKKLAGDCCALVGFVLQTSALSSDPHEVEVTLNGRNVGDTSCSCKAGNYKCKHLVAMLLHINARKTFNVLSSTDLPQKWGKGQKKAVSEKYAPRRIVDLPCLEKVKRDPVPLPRGDLLGRLLEGLPYRSAAQRHTEEIRPLENAAAPAASGEPPAPRLPTLTRLIATTTSSNLGEFVEEMRATFSADVCAAIEERTRQQSQSNDWLMHRMGMATSTRCYSFKTKAEKLKKEPMPHNLGPILNSVLCTSTFQSADMRRGIMMEPDARKKYAQILESQGHTCIVSNRGLLVWDQFPLMGCSPDGIVTFTCECCEGKERVLEIKCPRQVANAFSKGKPTAPFYTQIQVQMGITNIAVCDFFVYGGGENWRALTVPFDAAHFNKCAAAVYEVYERYLFATLKGLSEYYSW
ncbi:uncharacterized protein LOC8052905 [Ixodes scapularis]|uniref:uncharacterized protein LOC8052905 n=1 Tax=Ixodes scapularis TaxID=6945 RepID=UPI001A9D5B94|nr:uncharacterized protein LOC8052905 [Ixodes scapularis]